MMHAVAAERIALIAMGLCSKVSRSQWGLLNYRRRRGSKSVIKCIRSFNPLAAFGSGLTGAA